MKRCSYCGKIKTDEEFYLDLSKKDGLQNYCRQCSLQYIKKKRQTKEFIIKDRYIQIKKRAASNKRGSSGKQVLSKDEWLEFCQNSGDKLDELIDKWQKSGYSRELSPSIDRIDNNLGYEKGNLQWLSLIDNTMKFRYEQLGGVRKVKVLGGDKVIFFRSQRKAAEYLGVDRKTISKAIKKGNKIKKQYTIKYV